MLKIYNTITRQKQEFIPIIPNQVNIYVCGVTVYDYCHIGHARTYLFFDTLIRYLKFLGYQINFVRNITDVDDKILNKAKQHNESFEIITKKFIQAMQDDFDALNLLKPNFEPMATENIHNMINLINTLLVNKYAYIGSNGDIFYSIEQFKNYGLLSKRDFNNMQHTDRIEDAVRYAKKNIQDFVLWKLVDSQEVGWDSPWGYGRPGWHTECAAMSLKFSGNVFDIHGGGFDLMFPHHENEIAQCEAVTHNTCVNYWMHVGFLEVNQEKMSKSLGNFTLIREVLQKVHPEVIRYFMLSSHYRSQIEFSYDKLQVAKHSLDRLYLSLRNIVIDQVDLNIEICEQYTKKFQAAINDDFNTALGLSILFELSKDLNIAKEKSLAIALPLGVLLKKLSQSIGLLTIEPEEYLHTQTNNNYPSISTQEIKQLIIKRNQARQAKNWPLADLIRQQLSEQGIFLEDQGDETIWRS